MNDHYLTREESRRVDQVAIERYSISGLVLMENAGRGCADALCKLGINGPVAICCGKGNNAGDGFVIARHLDLRGHTVKVLLTCQAGELAGDAATNFAILDRMDIEVVVPGDGSLLRSLEQHMAGACWIVDALLGTGARGEPRAPLGDVIGLVNSIPARRLAVDIPSGLDCDSGQPAARTIVADYTCTFVARKTGFRAAAAAPFLGQIRVLDIVAPRQIVADVTGGRDVD